MADMAASESDFLRIITSARFELEAAGNPAYAIAVVTPPGEVQLSPMVFSNIGPASESGRRVAAGTQPGERVYLVSRSAADGRAMFAVLDPKSLKKLYQRNEVIEQSFLEADRPL
jgi:hypothetical protein